MLGRKQYGTELFPHSCALQLSYSEGRERYWNSTHALCEITIHSMFDHDGVYITAKMYEGRDYDGNSSNERKKGGFDNVLSRSGSNIKIKKKERKTRLSKNDLRKMLLSQRFSFMNGLQLLQEYALNSAYSIFGFEPLRNLLGVYKALEIINFDTSTS